MAEMEVMKKYGYVTIYRRTGKRLPLYTVSESPEISDEELGLTELTPLGPFLKDDQLEEIMYNCSGTLKVYHRRFGMCDTNVKIDPDVMADMIRAIAEFNNDVIDSYKPLLDGRLPDGSRINATLPPASPDGPTLTIRKFLKNPMTITHLIENGTIDSTTAAFLWLAVEGLGASPANIIISGGTGSGKTTTLNILASFIPEVQRIITIEDTAELQLMHEHWIRLESVLAGPSTKEVTMDALLKNALRMRPDRIIVGEVRGPEAQTLFTALNTGHDGCMGTLHANTAMETITRITNPPMNVPNIQVAALDLIVMQTRIMTPQRTVRRVTEISEIGGFEAGKPSLNPLYVWTARHGLKPTGVPSKLRERIAKAAGVPLTDLDMVLKNRKEVLDYMVQHQIKDLPGVKGVIQEYNYI